MKKFASICLVLCMMMSTVGASALASIDTANSAEMKEVLTIVKGKITVPEKYSEFRYRYNSQNDDSFWIFTWEWPNNGNIQIEVDSQGRVKNYSNYLYTNGKESRAPNFTREEAQAKAKAFAQKAIPEVFNSLADQPNYWVASGGQDYVFTYNRYENGVVCINQQVSIRVSYITGEVENLSVNWLYDVEFIKVDSPISQEQAKQTWKEKTNLQLKYLYDYGAINSVGKTIKAYLAYIPLDETKSVNAATGEILDKEYAWEYDSGEESYKENVVMDSATGGSASSSNRVELSEEELKKLDELSNLLTLNQADQKVRSFTQLSLSSNFRISSSNLVADSYAYPVTYGEDEGIGYSWRIVYTGPVAKEKSPQTIYVTVDAVTGELESYRDYESNELNANKTAKIMQSQALAIADGFIKKVSIDKAENVLAAEIAPVASWIESEKEMQEVGWNFDYVRANEGIAVANDRLNVSVNRMTGKITGYSRTWQEKVEFETVSGIIDEKTAIASYIDNAKAKLEYHIFTTYLYDVEEKAAASEKAVADMVIAPVEIRNKKSTVLVYAFESPSTVISAKTGRYINSNGAEVLPEEAKEFLGYTDTRGHYAQRQISLLADIGVLPQRDKFMPYQAVKQKDFLYYLFMAANSYRMYTSSSDDGAVIDEVYATALSTGVITEKEVNKEAAVTRYQAIRFLVRYLGLGQLASDANIFKVNFADAAVIPAEYIGSVAIGKSMQIIGGSNGRFNGSNYLSNGDAAKMIYNTLKKSA